VTSRGIGCVFLRVVLASLALASARSTPLAAQLLIEGYLGGSYSVPTPLTIVQQSYPDLKLTAHYSTRPFNDSWYYGWRVGYFWGRKGLLFDLVHQKLYLENPPPEVQDFRVTYGYNILTLGPAWKTKHLTLNLGAGPVVGNPYSNVRGQVWTRDQGLFNAGYYFGGAALQGGAGWNFRIVGRFFLSLDARFTAAYAQVPIRSGHADVPNLAFHLLAGAGYGW
jgi:hypothetical protein